MAEPGVETPRRRGVFRKAEPCTEARDSGRRSPSERAPPAVCGAPSLQRRAAPQRTFRIVRRHRLTRDTYALAHQAVRILILRIAGAVILSDSCRERLHKAGQRRIFAVTYRRWCCTTPLPLRTTVKCDRPATIVQHRRQCPRCAATRVTRVAAGPAYRWLASLPLPIRDRRCRVNAAAQAAGRSRRRPARPRRRSCTCIARRPYRAS